MGLDAYIYFEKIRPLEFDREFPSGFTLRESLPESSRTPLGATHELECPCRYYGVTEEDAESRGLWLEGFVVRELSPIASNFRSQEALDAYLKRHKVVAIDGVDTRALVAKLRKP